MKMENKRAAQAKRAKEREKKARIRKLMQFLWVPFAVAVIILLVVIVKNVNASKNAEAAAAAEGSYEENTEESSESAALTLNTDPSLVVEDGDTVNIDYIGYVDGVEFNGGNTKGAGADLGIGTGTYIDGFEEQIIGHNVGETFDINVTFPDGYGSTTTVDGDAVELSNKDVVFTITLNGIYK